MNYANMNIYYGTKCKLFYEAYRTVSVSDPPFLRNLSGHQAFFKIFSKLNLSNNFTICSLWLLLCIFSKFCTYVFNSITVCMYVYIIPVVMSLCDYLSVCVFLLGKNFDQAGGPETFFNFAWPSLVK